MFFAIAGAASLPMWMAWKLAGISSRSGQRVIRRLFWIHMWWMRATGMLRLEARGFEAMRDMRGTIIVSNHPALLDAAFLIAHLPPTACVMRADLLRNPFLRGGALAGGYVTNDSGPGFVRQGIEKVRAGENLLVFPEGTRTLTPPVNRFKNGFALVAARTGAPVRTVVIEYRGTHLTKGVSLFTPADVPLRFTIRTGEIFHADPGETAPDFSRRIEAWFRKELAGPAG
ncbi:MAG: lysophospholipid acyltransferase family protein [Verrucomicrobiae bacterium]